MKETENITSYVARVTSLVNQIRCYGDIVEEKKIVIKILRTLVKKFAYVTIVIQEAKNINTLSLPELIGSLKSHEEVLKEHEDPP